MRRWQRAYVRSLLRGPGSSNQDASQENRPMQISFVVAHAAAARAASQYTRLMSDLF